MNILVKQSYSIVTEQSQEREKIMNNDMKVNEFLELCENNGNIHEYEELGEQKQELEERIKSYEITYEQEDELQKKLEATKKALQKIEKKMTSKEKRLVREKKKLIDDTKCSIEFLAASSVIPENDEAGTTSIYSMISKEEFAQCYAPFYHNPKLLEEVSKLVSDEVLSRICEYTTHPVIEKALQETKGIETIDAFSEFNTAVHILMRKKGIIPKNGSTYSLTEERFAIYATNGLLKEIAPETKISESQLLNLAATMIRTDDESNPYTSADIVAVYRSGLHQENQGLTLEQQEQIEYITIAFLSEKLKGKSQDEVIKECKEWNLTEKQKNAVAEAVAKAFHN